MSPFLVSGTGIGYERHAYVWVRFGVWTAARGLADVTPLGPGEGTADVIEGLLPERSKYHQPRRGG
jgi:hypothetical protein